MANAVASGRWTPKEDYAVVKYAIHHMQPNGNVIWSGIGDIKLNRTPTAIMSHWRISLKDQGPLIEQVKADECRQEQEAKQKDEDIQELDADDIPLARRLPKRRREVDATDARDDKQKVAKIEKEPVENQANANANTNKDAASAPVPIGWSIRQDMAIRRYVRNHTNSDGNVDWSALSDVADLAGRTCEQVKAQWTYLSSFKEVKMDENTKLSISVCFFAMLLCKPD